MLALDFGIGAALAQPYPGLRSFEPWESFLFFGRQTHTNELLRRPSTKRMLTVVGTSGSGKSSLVRAGLLPALYRGHLAGAGSSWRIAVMRPGSAPLDELTNSLVAAELFDERGRQGVRKTIGLTSMGLIDAIRQVDPHRLGSLLIVVDQFEELFRFRPDREKEDESAEAALFVAALIEAVDQIELPVYVVLTMRSDFLGDCAQFVGLPEALNRSQYLIPRLTREERQEAIEGPLRVAGARISVRLVQRLLNDAGEDPDQLPVLQHALMATFRKWKEQGGEGEIDLHHYEEAGTMADAINRHAESVYQSLPIEDHDCAQRIFRCLTTTEGGRAVRRPGRLERIFDVVGALGDSVRQERFERVMRRFAAPENNFLVLPKRPVLKPDSVVDISHESLIRKWVTLQGWVKEEAESADWYQSLVRDAKLYETGFVGLWRDPNLKQAWHRKRRDEWNQAWADQYCPGFEKVTKFLENSRSKQRHARILRGSIVTLALLLAGAGYLKYRNDLYEDRRTELELRATLAKTEDTKAQILSTMQNLRDEIRQDPAKLRALQARLDEQNQQLQKLQVDSENAIKQLATHQNDRGSQDPIVKSAYAQIDSLQAQLNALRAPGACIQGYVWREAKPSDHVCVTPAVRDQVATDNNQAAARRAGGGPYGPDTCKQGYVWRDAYPGDHVCVAADVRNQAAIDNRQAQNRICVP